MASELKKKHKLKPNSCGDGGIGHALANNFVQNGFIVIATMLPHESRTHLEHAKIHVVDLDVTKEDQMIPFKSTLEEITGGTLDVLVNNA